MGVSRRLFAFLRKADYIREFDVLLRRLEDELDAVEAMVGGGGGGSVGAGFDCMGTVSVGDAVYLAGSDLIARASAQSIATAPAIGFVISKPTSTTAVITYRGEVNWVGPLSTGLTYYLALEPGKITSDPPSEEGHVSQKLGFARNNSTLIAEVDSNIAVL